YDHRRAATRPYRAQREPKRFGRNEFYGWSEDKARQYAVPLRADFGAFVRAKNFRLDLSSVQALRIRKMSTPPASDLPSSVSPVWRNRFGISILVSGSVHSATMRSPDFNTDNFLRTRSAGSGHFKPRKFIVV